MLLPRFLSARPSALLPFSPEPLLLPPDLRWIGGRKKFKHRNSIGKTKKKDSRYITRTQAVAKLQVALKDFRKLCILKGVYPREPKKKAKNGNTTYFFAKDIQFLQHEPLLAAFREQKVRAHGLHARARAVPTPAHAFDHATRTPRYVRATPRRARLPQRSLRLQMPSP